MKKMSFFIIFLFVTVTVLFPVKFYFLGFLDSEQMELYKSRVDSNNSPENDGTGWNRVEIPKIVASGVAIASRSLYTNILYKNDLDREAETSGEIAIHMQRLLEPDSTKIITVWDKISSTPSATYVDKKNLLIAYINGRNRLAVRNLSFMQKRLQLNDVNLAPQQYQQNIINKPSITCLDDKILLTWQTKESDGSHPLIMALGTYKTPEEVINWNVYKFDLHEIKIEELDDILFDNFEVTNNGKNFYLGTTGYHDNGYYIDIFKSENGLDWTYIYESLKCHENSSISLAARRYRNIIIVGAMGGTNYNYAYKLYDSIETIKPLETLPKKFYDADNNKPFFIFLRN